MDNNDKREDNIAELERELLEILDKKRKDNKNG